MNIKNISLIIIIIFSWNLNAASGELIDFIDKKLKVEFLQLSDIEKRIFLDVTLHMADCLNDYYIIKRDNYDVSKMKYEEEANESSKWCRDFYVEHAGNSSERKVVNIFYEHFMREIARTYWKKKLNQ